MSPMIPLRKPHIIENPSFPPQPALERDVIDPEGSRCQWRDASPSSIASNFLLRLSFAPAPYAASCGFGFSGYGQARAALRKIDALVREVAGWECGLGCDSVTPSYKHAFLHGEEAFIFSGGRMTSTSAEIQSLDDLVAPASGSPGKVTSTYANRILPTDLTISKFLNNLRERRYQIPTFQRDVVWEAENVKKLWDSLYKFYPLGSILVWRTDIQLHRHRAIGGVEIGSDEPLREFHYLLDGQQRTTALFTSIFGGAIAGRPGFNPQLCVDLTVGDSSDVDDVSYRQRFLFAQEILEDPELRERYAARKIVKLQDVLENYLGVESALEKLGYEFSHPARESLRRFMALFSNYRLSIIELNGIQVAEVCEIFARVNTGGKPLNIFDIVVAKTYRPAEPGKGLLPFYLREMFDAFRDSPQMSQSPYRNLSDLDYLQMLAVVVKFQFGNQCDVENITDRYLPQLRADHVEHVWERATYAFRETFHFLHHQLHLGGPGLVPYRYLYMVLAAYFYNIERPDYSLLRRYFWTVSFHQKDLLSGTSQMWAQARELIAASNAAATSPSIPSFSTLELDKADLRTSSYNSKSRFYRAVVGFFASQEPRDWAPPHERVLANTYYQATDQPNLHHVFPRAFVERDSFLHGKQLGNSLMNIAYLTQITNLDISDQNPVDYLKDYVGEAFNKVMESHLIGTDLARIASLDELPADALLNFVEARIDNIISELRGLGLTVNVTDSATPATVVTRPVEELA
ncbi:DUF262 domain-containing protein [Paraburkholderia sp. RCC_158]|uniref:GmrSD restriction endonuclease domain-containing protein n=1 Tax=Paraburkholderia sp. RCC_158 TaxID=3239220 RepID=UPI00352489D5